MKYLKILLISIAKKNQLARILIRTLLLWRDLFPYLFFFFKEKVDNNMVIFKSFMGRNYSDSPKALYLEMLNNSKFSHYKFIWCFEVPEKYVYLKQNQNTYVVKFNSLEYKKYSAKAAYWVTNSILPEYLLKKKKQKYIQCWHGTPLKKLRYDIEVKSGNVLNSLRDIRKRNDRDVKRYDIILSPSPFCTEKFTSAFNLKKHKKEHIIIEEGYPRNDFLFQFTEKDVEKIKNRLHCKDNRKVILYAPTFRDNQHESGLGYTYKLGLNFDTLQTQLQDEYVILFRTHYFISNSFDFGKYTDFIYDVSKYDDITELYTISDMLITDYSSVFFDYANLNRPIYFYMYDFEEYKNNLRDFYFDLELLPGPIMQKEHELLDEIKSLHTYWDRYASKYEAFRKMFNPLDDKNCSKRVVEKIFQ